MSFKPRGARRGAAHTILQRVTTAEKLTVPKGINWGCGDLDGKIGQFTQEALREMLRANPPDASLPFYWGDTDGHGGPPVRQPDTVYFQLPAFSANGDTGPVWKTTVRDLVEDAMANCFGDPLDSSSRENFEAFRKSLVETIARLDDFLSYGS